MNIPEELKQIRIDVGLAGEAPNSALWLSQTTDRFVIGIEPLPYHWKMIKNFETSNSKRPYPKYIPLLQLEENVVKLAKKMQISNICSLACAHPVKFQDTVNRAINENNLIYDKSINFKNPERYDILSNDYSVLKKYIIEHA